MIRRLTGRVLAADPNSVVLEVSGVGYLVFTSEIGDNFLVDSEITLHTYQVVRENVLDLYGFRTQEELEIFELLISLPKIGPKSAAQILNQADINLLKASVNNNDPGYLAKMSGIGKKSAEKIVAGLKELFERKGLLGEVDVGTDIIVQQQASDTIDALVALGYQPSDARQAVQQAAVDNPDVTDSGTTIKLALKLLSK